MKDNVVGRLRRYTNTTLHEHNVVLADGIGSVASENRDRQLFVLGWLKSSQSLTSNVAYEAGMAVEMCLMTFTNKQ